MTGPRPRPKAPPTEVNRQLARDMRALFGGAECHLIQYLDRDETSEIHVLHSTETPGTGLTSYCTIGLSDYADEGYEIDPPLGVEIVGVSDVPDFGEILSTAAFCVINSGYRARPGGVFPGVVKLHHTKTTVPDLMFVPPYLWPDEALSSREYAGEGAKTVAWLQALPITGAETEYVLEHGADALTALFETHDPDFADLRRSSVV